jgi:hypothetical protein
VPILILHRYRTFDPIRRRWYVTPAMTEQDAPRLNGATRLEWSREERTVSDDSGANRTSAFLYRSGKRPDSQ